MYGGPSEYLVLIVYEVTGNSLDPTIAKEFVGGLCRAEAEEEEGRSRDGGDNTCR